MGFYGAWKDRRDYVFTYLVLTVLVFVKNIGLLIHLAAIDDRTRWENAAIAIAVIEEVLTCVRGLHLPSRLARPHTSTPPPQPLGVWISFVLQRELAKEDSYMRSRPDV